MKHSESIPTKKISIKISWLCHFFTILAVLAEKWQSLRKKNYKGKIFDFKIFGLKHVLKYSESMPTKKKILDQNFFDFVIFSLYWAFGRKNRVPGKNFTRENFFEGAKKISSKFNVKYIEMIPVKFFTTLIFSSRNFNFFQFLMNCPHRWKIKKF